MILLNSKEYCIYYMLKPRNSPAGATQTTLINTTAFENI